MRQFIVCLSAPIALIAICVFGTQVRGQAPGQGPYSNGYYTSAEQVSEAAYSAGNGIAASMDCGCEGDCGGDCSCGGECGCGGVRGALNNSTLRNGQFYAGVDWLHVRANFSEATAYLQRDLNNFVDTFHQIDYDYNNSYRFYGGYRLCDCCSEIQFAYTRLRSEGTADGGPATSSMQFIAPLEVLAIIPGDTLSVSASVNASTYDLDFAKTIPLGSPFDDCSCCWCPAWDIKWFGGLRYADVDWTRTANSVSSTAVPRRYGRTQMDFNGFGLRTGLEGRRYIGRQGRMSVYAKGTMNLLLGDVNYSSIQNDAASPGINPAQYAKFTRVIPVTELEAGISAQVRCNITLTAGYMLQAWHDLGMGDQYDFGLQTTYDDANILGFDGFFVRAEVAY